MNLSSKRWLTGFAVWSSAAVCGLLLGVALAVAQNDESARDDAERIKSMEERVRIEPYTGPPIYLDEKKVLVEPRYVTSDVITDKYDSGQVRLERQVAKFSDNHYEPDGFYREFYPDGKPFVEGQYRRGRQDGQWTYWYDNGQTNRKMNFTNGRLDGSWEVWRRDATLLAKREYVNGLRQGEWLVFDETGNTVLKEEHYDAGIMDGVWKFWYENGKPQREVSLKQGVRHGVTTEWDVEGKPRSKSNWVEGKLDGTTTIWLTDGRKVTQQYKDGLLVSEREE